MSRSDPGRLRVTASGLYVPDHGPAPSDRRDQAMLRATRAQAWATGLAAVVAVVALGLSWLAWTGQNTLNRQQQDVNDYLLARALRVYAARVAVWAIGAPGTSSVRTAGLDVHVQNRAPVPIRAVTLIAPLEDGTEATVTIGEVEPCTLVTFRLSPPPGGEFRTRDDDWLGYSGLRLVFAETDRRWRLTNGALEPLPAGGVLRSPDDRALLIPGALAGEPIGDCSESG